MDRVKEEVTEGDCTPWMDSGVVVKQEPAWSMEEDSRDQPSAVYSTVQPMSDNTSGSLLSLKRGCMCQHCSAAFVLVSSLELHLTSVHGEPLPFPEWTESSDRQMSLPHGRLSTEETDHVRKYSADLAVDFVVKLEPVWSMEEDSPDQPSAVYSTEQPLSDKTSESLLSLKRGRVCQHCSAAFVLFSSLELHLTSVHGEKLHMLLPGSSKPDRCDAGHCSNTDIDKVVDGHNSREKTTSKVDCRDTGDINGTGRETSRLHVCDVCKKSFGKSDSLKKHKMIHSGVKPFVCDVCSISFTHAGDLTKHKRTHFEDRPYECQRCDKDFKRSGDLQRHIKSVHDGARPHVCDVCGAAFSKSCNLTVHKRSHTGEKPYVCFYCGKGFADSTTLRKHNLIHTGEKSHVCSDCGKGFAESSNLRNHRLTHTGQKPHVCSDCGKAFAQSSTLGRHRLTHSKKKPHCCPHCPAAFTQSHNLKKHIKKVHHQ